MDTSESCTLSYWHVQAVVKSITKLNVICPMCNEEKATATMKPCGHKFCPGKSFCIRVLYTQSVRFFALLVKIAQREWKGVSTVEKRLLKKKDCVSVQATSTCTWKFKRLIFIINPKPKKIPSNTCSALRTRQYNNIRVPQHLWWYNVQVILSASLYKLCISPHAAVENATLPLLYIILVPYAGYAVWLCYCGNYNALICHLCSYS